MKLKPIPENTVVHTPTEAEAKELLAILHENGYKWSGNEDLIKYTNWKIYKYDTCYKLGLSRVTFSDKEFFIREVHTILTFAEFKSKYCKEDKPQPKFKVGDKVYCPLFGYPLVIAEVVINDNDEPYYYFENCGRYRESILKPYTETEPTKDMETKENHDLSQNSAEKCGNDNAISTDENKELDLCELLNGLEGQSFYSPCYGDVDLIEVHNDKIVISAVANDKKHTLGKRGKHCAGFAECMCMLFPSLAIYEQYPLDPYTAWMKWQEEQTIFHIRIEFQPYEERGEMKCGKMGPLHFNDLKLRTPADRDEAIEEIKAIIEKYNKK